MNAAPMLIALALAGVVTAPALPIPVAAQEAVQPTASQQREFTITTQQAFDELFANNGTLAKISAATSPNTFSTVTVKLASMRFRLPTVIEAPRVKLVITSAQPVRPLGVEHENTVLRDDEGALLYAASGGQYGSGYSTIIASPTVISNVRIEQYNHLHPTFIPIEPFRLENIQAESDPQASPTWLVHVDAPGSKADVSITNSRIDRVKPLRIRATSGTSHFEKNILVSQPKDHESLLFTMMTVQPLFAANPGDHKVTKNLFSQDPGNIAVNIERPGVTVEGNEFYLTQDGGTPSVGIRAGYSRMHSMNKPLLSSISVSNNVFTGLNRPSGAVGVQLTQNNSFADKGITVSNNDFSAIRDAVKITDSWKQDNGIAFTKNYVGNAAIALSSSSVKDALGAPPSGIGLGGQPSTPPGITPPVQPPSGGGSGGSGGAPALPPAQPPAEEKPEETPTPKPGEPPVTRAAVRTAGETRFETAVALAKQQFAQPVSTVVLARADVAADSVSAVPLADALKAPVLLTPQNLLHPAVGAEIKRLLPQGGKVVVMGGEAAIGKPVIDALGGLGVQVDRIAGDNRAGTAVATAEYLRSMGLAKQVLLADGADWQPDLIAGPAAAAVRGVTLLTNGDAMAPETRAYLERNAQTPVTPIGEKAARTVGSKEAITADSPTDLSIQVAKRFFTHPKAVGLATTADFADALAGGAHIAHNNGPILLSPANLPTTVPGYLNDVRTVSTVFVYGGTTRLNNGLLDSLKHD